MKITQKALLGVLAIGIGGAGYFVGTLTRSQPTKATVELEPTSHKENTSSSDKQSSNDKQSSHDKQSTKAKDSNSASKQTKDKTDDHKNQQPQTSTRKDVAGQNDKSNKHANKRLFLTGKNTEQEYSPKLIKHANEIYKHRTDLSFRECLELARKEID